MVGGHSNGCRDTSALWEQGEPLKRMVSDELGLVKRLVVPSLDVLFGIDMERRNHLTQMRTFSFGPCYQREERSLPRHDVVVRGCYRSAAHIEEQASRLAARSALLVRATDRQAP
jgi:hypothetical protein